MGAMRAAVVVMALLVTVNARAQPATASQAFAAAKQLHADAQAREHAAACGPLDRACTAQLVPLFEAAERAYADYLVRFPSAADAVEARYFRADILNFKLGKPEAAGDLYLAVGRSQPVGRWHRDALMNAITMFDTARGKTPSPIDDKLRAAADLFATTFAGGPEVVGITYRIALLNLDRGKTDEAIRAFAMIVTKYPNAPESGAAGDYWLEALASTKDYAKLGDAVRVLAKLPAFASAEQQARLASLQFEVATKLADEAAATGHHADAADAYLRAAGQTTDPKRGAQAMFNAAVMFEKAHLGERASQVYRAIAEKFPATELAPRALFAAATLDVALVEWKRAADAYEQVTTQFPKSEVAADALVNAGHLRQALGESAKAIALYDRYAALYTFRPDAATFALEAASLREQTGDPAGALAAYLAVAAMVRKQPLALEALVGSGRVALALGSDAQAATQLTAAFALATGDRAHPRWLAEIGVLRARLAAKAKRWADAERELATVVDLGDPAWAVAALRETAAIHEQLATTIEARAQVVDAYRAAYTKALALGFDGPDTVAIRDALVRLGAIAPDTMAREPQHADPLDPAFELALHPR